MKIYIETDMEGISGISDKSMIERNDRYALERLMTDTNAAIRGAFDGGADEVIVEDGHGGGNNFIKEMLDARAVQVTHEPVYDCDACFMVGVHAKSGTEHAFYDHTQSSVSWHDYYINGRACGEMAQLGAFAGAFGIPIVMVSGDFAACAEAREFFGNIKTACVKYGIGHVKAECIPDDEAERLIYEAARSAVSIIKDVQPFRVVLPAEIKVEFNRTDYCDAYMERGRKDIERLDGRTVRRIQHTIEKYSDILM